MTISFVVGIVVFQEWSGKYSVLGYRGTHRVLHTPIGELGNWEWYEDGY